MQTDLRSLRALPVSERLNKAHPFLRQLVALAQETCNPESILIFGSRARGDHRANSDFDIAFKGVIAEDGWAHLTTILQESAETLVGFDLVRYEEVELDFRHKIDLEGITIYERKS